MKRYLHVGSHQLVLGDKCVQPGESFSHAFSDEQETHLLQARVIARVESDRAPQNKGK